MKEVLSNATNRRSLLKKLAVASAAVTATSQAQSGPNPAPADVVQFALNLEYLEAEFYSIATTAQTLQQNGFPVTGSGNAGPTVTQFNYSTVNLGSSGLYAAARNIAADEINHVVLLRTALSNNGVTPIAKPAINLDALLSMGISLSNQAGFLIMARIFEDIGVSAYTGGAVYLAGSPYLTTAARIAAVEGEHVANIRAAIASLGIPTTAIDGADVPPPPTGGNYFSTNLSNGLCAYRTPGQVLYLAYGNVAGVTSGGFFPNGVNGVLNTSSAPATSANLGLI